MFDNFTHHWRALCDDGRISEDEFRRATFAQHYRTIEEFTAPFADSQSAVRQAGLKLVSVETRLTPCPYNAAYQSAGGQMSKADYAASLIPTMRSWSETVFKTALEGRPEAECQATVDAFYGAYEAQVAADPEGSRHGLYSYSDGDRERVITAIAQEASASTGLAQNHVILVLLLAQKFIAKVSKIIFLRC